MNRVLSLSVALCLSLVAISLQADEPKVVVKGLFNGAAVLEINGRRILLKEGKSTEEGVHLISATSKQAVIEIADKRRTLSLSDTIGAAYSEAERSVVRLNSKHNGHFFGTAKINGRSTQFLVDTGASYISMSSVTADQLGIKYKHGALVRMATAQGTALGYRITLNRVDVGSISLRKVTALVSEGEYPLDMLLGNSFLSQTEMNIQNGVLVLKSKF